MISGREARRERGDLGSKRLDLRAQRLFLLLQPLEARRAHRKFPQRLVECLQAPAIVAGDREDGRVSKSIFSSAKKASACFRMGGWLPVKPL